MEFDEFRKYVPGDDVKHIDWKVTARTREAHLKVFKEERDQTILIMVDVSGSQYFGLKETREKVSAAAELAALFAILATKNNDKVGLLIFTDEVEHYIPPASGKAHVFKLIRDVLMHKGVNKGTNISDASKYALKVLRKKSLVVLISDFQDDKYLNEMKKLSKLHDLVCANIYDEAEINPPKSSMSGFVDPETGDFIDLNYELDTSSSNLFEDWKKSMIKIGADPFLVKADESSVVPLIKFLKSREAKLSR
jgi:uncharacterized protein (DUF58 family)